MLRAGTGRSALLVSCERHHDGTSGSHLAHSSSALVLRQRPFMKHARELSTAAKRACPAFPGASSVSAWIGDLHLLATTASIGFTTAAL